MSFQSIRVESTLFSAELLAKLDDYAAGRPLAVSRVSYPQNTASPADRAEVSVGIVVGDRETKVEAKKVGSGRFEALLPAALVDGLEFGTYSIIAESSLGGEDSPGLGSTVFLKF